MTRALLFIIAFGIISRISIFAFSPPSNAYDDHLEAVSKTMVAMENYERVKPWDCWQCYQPPLYYWTSSAIISFTSTVLSNGGSWKSVQALSLLASVGTLLLTVLALKIVLPKPEHLPAVCACTAMMSILPRALYSCAMATNDAFLEFAVATTLLGYLLLTRGEKRAGLGMLLVLLGTVTGCWTKQSGLVLLVPLVGLLIATLAGVWRPPAQLPRATIVVAVLVALVLASLDELWRFHQSGIFLVSNQQYFAYTNGQAPGSISRINFFDFRFIKLMEDVFMSSTTIASFWTELAARFWFDYERRFFPINTYSLGVGRVIYLAGAPLTLYLLYFKIVGLIMRPRDLKRLILFLFSSAFLAVPILQTLRFPYYSSMKAIFVLPGLPAILCLTALGLATSVTTRTGRFAAWGAVACAILIGLINVLSQAMLSNEAWRFGLSGPLWPLPPLP